jgi:hypothetical protein
LIDISAGESFHEYDPIPELVKNAVSVGYTARVLVTLDYISDYPLAVQRVRNVVKSGATRIFLRLDETVQPITLLSCVENFANACAATGIRSEVRFEFENELPETFFAVANVMEAARFYTSTLPVKRKSSNRRYSLVLRDVAELSEMNNRVVVCENGDVLLRQRSTVVTDTYIGNLRNVSLFQLVDPQRLRNGRGGLGNAP